jgi:hypothetical protein
LIALVSIPFVAFSEEEIPPVPVAPPPAACSTEEFRQLDFWVGNWEVSWVDAKGETQTGANSVTIEKDGCVIEENFKIPGFEGNSLSIYHKPYGGWRQAWVDNQGGFFDLTGGPDAEGFKLTMVRLKDQAPHLRMIWRNIEADSLDWHWQGSKDEGTTWEDSWHLHYERVGE